MKIQSLAIALLSVIASLPVAVQASTCKVTDPTGTPLNVRDDINGRVITKLANNKIVQVQDYQYDKKGRPWAYISYHVGKKTRQGWIYREFISCY